MQRCSEQPDHHGDDVRLRPPWRLNPIYTIMPEPRAEPIAIAAALPPENPFEGAYRHAGIFPVEL